MKRADASFLSVPQAKRNAADPYPNEQAKIVARTIVDLRLTTPRCRGRNHQSDCLAPDDTHLRIVQQDPKC